MGSIVHNLSLFPVLLLLSCGLMSHKTIFQFKSILFLNFSDFLLKPLKRQSRPQQTTFIIIFHCFSENFMFQVNSLLGFT